jgi:hypothetical protein
MASFQNSEASHTCTSDNGKLKVKVKVKVKVKLYVYRTWTGPEGSRSLRFPEFLDNRHMKVAKLSALGTGHLYSPGNIPGTHLC